MLRRFEDRTEAGWKLAEALSAYDRREDTLVLALPRGGVPLAYEIAETLSLPLDVWLVRKLGVPGHEELAMGAIALGGVCHINEDVVNLMGITPGQIDRAIETENKELQRRNEAYRDSRSALLIDGKTIIVVDDGLATGATMRAAVESLRQAKAAYIIVAVPVGSASTCEELKSVADEVICLYKPTPFYGVGQWYKDFSQLDDDAVRELLDRHILHNLEAQSADFQ